MTRNILLLLTSTAMFLAGCSVQEEQSLSDYRWLLGDRWMIEGETTVYEEWKEKSEDCFVGKNYYLAGETGMDTVLLETIELKILNSAVVFCPKVILQPEEKTVEFTLISTNPDSLVFENKEHDFPTRIGYIKDGKNIDAWIEGIQEGKPERISFYFNRTE